jgi:hypothetical protein
MFGRWIDHGYNYNISNLDIDNDITRFGEAPTATGGNAGFAALRMCAFDLRSKVHPGDSVTHGACGWKMGIRDMTNIPDGSCGKDLYGVDRVGTCCGGFTEGKCGLIGWQQNDVDGFKTPGTNARYGCVCNAGKYWNAKTFDCTAQCTASCDSVSHCARCSSVALGQEGVPLDGVHPTNSSCVGTTYVDTQIPGTVQVEMIGCICPPGRMGASCRYPREIILDCGRGLEVRPRTNQTWTCKAQNLPRDRSILWDGSTLREHRVLYDCSIKAGDLLLVDTILNTYLSGTITRSGVEVKGADLFSEHTPPVPLAEADQCNVLWDAVSRSPRDLVTFCRVPLLMARGKLGCIVPDPDDLKHGLFGRMYGNTSVFCRAWPDGYHTDPTESSQYLYRCENIPASISMTAEIQILGNLPELLLVDCIIGLDGKYLRSPTINTQSKYVASAIVGCCSVYGNRLRPQEVIQCA